MKCDMLELSISDCSSDDTCLVTGVVRCGQFAGRGHAWFSRSTISEFAGLASQFPLPADEPPELRGGYYGSHGARLADERLGIDIREIDEVGHIGVRVRLAAESDPRRPKLLHRVSVELVTGYQQLAEFCAALQRCVDERGGNAKLAVPVIDGPG